MDNTGLIQEVQFQTDRSAEDVETDLGAMDGVRSVSYDSDNKIATVRFDPTVVDENRIRQAAQSGTDATSLVGDLPAGNAQPVAGLDAAYGGVDRSPATQGQPPANTV